MKGISVSFMIPNSIYGKTVLSPALKMPPLPFTYTCMDPSLFLESLLCALL